MSASPLTVREGGKKELMGDLLIQCIGGIPTPSGQPVPRLTLTIYFSALVSSQIYDNVTMASEAVLLIDEPSASEQLICPVGGTCPAVGVGGSANYYKQPGIHNVYQGTVQNNNQVVFSNVAYDQLGIVGGAPRTFRVKNVRLDLGQVPPGTVDARAFVSTDYPQPMPISNVIQVVGLLAAPLQTTYRDGANTGTLLGATSLGGCASHNANLAQGTQTDPAAFLVRFEEQFASAFKTWTGQAWSNADTAPTPVADSTLTGQYIASESGFSNYGFSSAGNLNILGRAHYGTRFYLMLQNVPDGVDAFVTAYARGKTAANSPIRALTPGVASPDVTPTTPATINVAGIENGLVKMTSFPGGIRVAVYEYTGLTPTFPVVNDPAIDVPVFVSYTAPVTASGPITAKAGIAPVSLLMMFSEVVPLFQDTAAATPVVEIVSCPQIQIGSTVGGVASNQSVTITGASCNAGTYSTPQAFNWAAGSTCGLDFPQRVPASGTPPTILERTTWLDNPAAPFPRSIVVPAAPASYIAQYDRRHQVCATVTPPGSCGVTLGGADITSACAYFTEGGGALALAATPHPGFQFASFTGDVSSTVNPAGLTVNGPKNVTATCTGCSAVLGANSANAPAEGLFGSVTVTAAAGCAWGAASNTSWIKLLTPGSNQGMQTVQFAVEANLTTSARQGSLTLAGQTFTVNQAAGGAGPGVLAILPGAGTMAQSQAFAATFGHPASSAQLKWAQVLFAVSPGGGGQSFCLLHFDNGADRFWLYSDIVGFFKGPVAPGQASNALQGSLCALNTEQSGFSEVGGTLTLNLRVVFKQAGARNVYLRTYSQDGVDTGWQQRGAVVLPTPGAPGPFAVAPNSGGVATTQTFSAEYSDPPGFAGLAHGWVQFLVSSPAPFCFLHYDRAGNGLWSYSPTSAFFLGPVSPGTSSNVLDTVNCSLNPAATTVTNAGGKLTVTWPITFKAPMTGTRTVFQRMQDALERDSGWQNMGTVVVP